MLISKTASKYALYNESQKLTTPPKPQHLFGSTSTCQHTWQVKTCKKNPKALCVDLMFTADSLKSVSCDAMTNIGSCLDETS